MHEIIWNYITSDWNIHLLLRENMQKTLTETNKMLQLQNIMNLRLNGRWSDVIDDWSDEALRLMGNFKLQKGWKGPKQMHSAGPWSPSEFRLIQMGGLKQYFSCTRTETRKAHSGLSRQLDIYDTLTNLLPLSFCEEPCDSWFITITCFMSEDAKLSVQALADKRCRMGVTIKYLPVLCWGELWRSLLRASN